MSPHESVCIQVHVYRHTHIHTASSGEDDFRFIYPGTTFKSTDQIWRASVLFTPRFPLILGMSYG